tara:strand:+ start:9109 stop:9948 length:840 start_codon:yes stop_codon:yes gene_type:complete
MNNNFLFILCSVFIVSSLSCISDKDEDIIASVNEKKLYLLDIKLNMPKYLEDSSYFVEKFINDWTRKQVMLSEAEMNLNSNLEKYEKQIEDYRASLLIHAYQKELLNQNFDTIITSFEIEEYYRKYKKELVLSNNIFKGRFIKIEKNVPEIDKIKILIKSENLSEIEDLKEYCIQFASDFYLNSEEWIYFKALSQIFPNIVNDGQAFLKNNTVFTDEDDKYMYYLYVKDSQAKESISPLSIVKGKIRSTILNTKKVNYLKDIEDELYQKALSKNKIKIY